MDSSANSDVSTNTGFTVKHEAIIGLVMRQTNYTRQDTIQKLKESQGDYIQVIKNYINPHSKPEVKEDKTVNQTIMSEIRYFMDGVNRGYEERKKKAAIKKKILTYHMLKQKQRQQQQQQQQRQQDKNIIIRPEEKKDSNKNP